MTLKETTGRWKLNEDAQKRMIALNDSEVNTAKTGEDPKPTK